MMNITARHEMLVKIMTFLENGDHDVVISSDEIDFKYSKAFNCFIECCCLYLTDVFKDKNAILTLPEYERLTERLTPVTVLSIINNATYAELHAILSFFIYRERTSSGIRAHALTDGIYLKIFEKIQVAVHG